MVKGIPFFNLLDKKELKNLHNDKFIIDVLREQLRQEMHSYTNNLPLSDSNDYYNAFVSKMNKLYSYEEYKKIFFMLANDKDSLINYFISREVKRFIKTNLVL
jgi:hypothetical protein